jgi:hypothetical protein
VAERRMAGHQAGVADHVLVSLKAAGKGARDED